MGLSACRVQGFPEQLPWLWAGAWMLESQCRKKIYGRGAWDSGHPVVDLLEGSKWGCPQNHSFPTRGLLSCLEAQTCAGLCEGKLHCVNAQESVPRIVVSVGPIQRVSLLAASVQCRPKVSQSTFVTPREEAGGLALVSALPQHHEEKTPVFQQPPGPVSVCGVEGGGEGM